MGAQDSYSLLAGDHEPFRASTDDHGRFALEVSYRGLALVLRSPDGGIVAVREDFRLDGSDVVLRLRPEDRPTGFLEGRLARPDGVKAAAPWFRLTGVDSPRIREGEFSGESFRIGPFPPGEYELRARDGGLQAQRTVRVDAWAARDLGTLELEHAGWIAVHLAHPEVALPRNEVVRTLLLRDGIHPSDSIRSGPGADDQPPGSCSLAPPLSSTPPGRSGDLAPGRYLLRTRHAHGVAPDVQVEVLPGQTSEVSLTLRPATIRTLLVQVPESDPAIHVSLRVTAKDRSFCWIHEGTTRSVGNVFPFDVEGLLPGSYRVEARSPSSGRREAEFEVLDLGTAPPITLGF